MAIYTDTIKLNRGINKDGAFWCQNIRPATDDGVFAGISMTNIAKRVEDTSTTNMFQILDWTQVGSGNTSIIFGIDANGYLYVSNYIGTKVSLASGGLDNSRSIILDSNGNVIFSGNKYIKIGIVGILDGGIGASDTNIQLINNGYFPNAGTALIADSVGNFELFSWTGKASQALTGCTRGISNTGGSIHASGTKVYYFNGTFKTLAHELTSSQPRRMMKWENLNFIGSGNVVEGYTAADASDLADKLTLSTGKEIVDFGQLPTSSTSYVLVGANSGENGYVYTWDGKDTTWIKELELKNNNITKMWENFIATDNGIYQYDGTNLNEIVPPIEDEGLIKGGKFTINDMKTVKGYLLYTGGLVANNRNRQGFYYVDLETKDRYFVLPSSYGTYNVACYGIFPTADLILLGTSYTGGAIDSLSELPATRGSIYQTIYKPSNAKVATLKELKLNISVDPKVDHNATNMTFDVIIRGYDFTRPFIKYGNLKSGETPTTSSQLIIDSSLGVPSIGDRVEITSRAVTTVVDSAYAPRNITAITAATGKYTIDVDDAFPVQINAATQNSAAQVVFNPLIALGKKKISVTTDKIDLQGYTIPLSIQPRFKKMLFEIEVRCTDTTISPQLNYLEVTYDA